MESITKKTENVLINAGWYKGSHIDTKGEIERLSSAGYKIFNSLIVFLAEFGNLDLHFQNALDVELSVSFDIGWALEEAGLYETDLIINDYPRAVGCKTLTLVGRKNIETVLAMSETGMIYSLNDGYILEVGMRINAIDNLVSKSYKDLKQIAIPDWWRE